MIMEYKDFKLKENPFRLTPPLNPEEIVWAGMEKLKSELENRLQIAMQTSYPMEKEPHPYQCLEEILPHSAELMLCRPVFLHCFCATI